MITKKLYLDSLKLRTLRFSKSLFQKDIADILCMSQQNYSNLELGKSEIDKINLNKLSDFLDVNSSKLLFESTKSNSSLRKTKVSEINNDENSSLLKTLLLSKTKQIKILKELISRIKELKKATLTNTK